MAEYKTKRVRTYRRLGATVGLAALLWGSSATGQPSPGQPSAGKGAEAPAEAEAEAKLPGESEESEGKAPAQTEPSPEQQGSPPTEEPPEAPSPEGYDSRAERGPGTADAARGWDEEPSYSPEDYFLFVPRALLFLPNLVLKAVFAPVQLGAEGLDEYHVIDHVTDLLYNDARTMAILPVVELQSGFGISAGAKVFHNDIVGNGEHTEVSARYGGQVSQAYKFTFEGDQVAHTPLWLEAGARYDARPELRFYGIGNLDDFSAATGPGQDPRSVAVETRFRERRVAGYGTVGGSLIRKSWRARLGITGIYTDREFGPEKEPEPGNSSIETVYDTSALTGFESGAKILEVGPRFVLDSRDRSGRPTHGVYLDAFGARAIEVEEPFEYWHYGVTAAALIEIAKKRTLTFRATHEAVIGGYDEIPFSDLIKLGGPARLRGYILDRFRDKNALVGTIEYAYPVHSAFSGEVFFDAGRVGRRAEDVFTTDDLRYGGGAGIVVHGEESPLFRIAAAYGEEFIFFLTTDPLEAFSQRHKRY